jgi:hypothetical protein
MASPSWNGCPQRGAEFSIALDVPLTAHRIAFALAALGIEQNPFPPPGRLGARSRIVLLETPIEIRRPADICPVIASAPASQNINEEGHLNYWRSREDSNFRPSV